MISALLGALAIVAVSVAISAFFWRSHLDPDLQRAHGMGRLADRLGWSFSPDDVFDYAALPFTLFAAGGRALNVLVGETHDRRPTCVFDYRRTDPTTGRTGDYTCVLTDLGPGAPRLVALPADPGARRPALDPADVGPAHTAGAVAVWAAADQPSRGGLGLDTLDWLNARWPDAHFEVNRFLLMAWFPRLAPRRVTDAIHASDGLRSRLQPAASPASGPGRL